MKNKLALTLLIVILSTPISGEILDTINLIKKNGLFYNKISDKLFTGFVVFKYDNGKIKSKGSFKNGMEDGYWVDFNQNGSLFSKGNYTKGLPHGNFKFYHENGELEEEGYFIFGVKEGNHN